MSKVIVLFNLSNNMPYGLMYIAMYLRVHGIRCLITDDIEYARKLQPDIVGISSMFNETKNEMYSTALYLKTYTKAKIVVGGNHACTFADEIIKNKYIDHVVVGEGEQAFLDIVNGCTDPIVKRPLIDIDYKYLTPAYDLVDVEKYIRNGNPYAMRNRTMGIISSRGCPNNCAYCSIGAVWGRSWRGRDSKMVVDEIEYLQKTYNVHEFSFLDDSMSIDKERLEGICQELIERKLNIKWTTPNGIAHWTLSPETLSMMKLSGCYRITFGIESGSPKIRKYIGKPYPLEQATALIKHANKIGLWTITTNIIGLPYEDVDDIEQTLSYAIKCGTDFACFYELIPHAGTRIAKDVDKILLDNLHISQRMMYREFIFSRLLTMLFRILRKIKSWEDFKYTCKLMKLGFKILFRTFKKKGHVLYG